MSLEALEPWERELVEEAIRQARGISRSCRIPQAHGMMAQAQRDGDRITWRLSNVSGLGEQRHVTGALDPASSSKPERLPDIGD